MPSGVLRGRTIVLTRQPEDNAPLAVELGELGATVVELPCVRTEPLTDETALRAAVASLTSDDVLVLTSRAGADAVASVLPREGVPCGIAAVGEATAAHAARLGLRVGFVATRADGATLARELPLPRGRVVLARSDMADGRAPAILAERGARVTDVAAYRTIARVAGDLGAVTDALARMAVVVVVASPSAVDALATAIARPLLGRATFVAIGPRTAARVAERVGVDAVVAGVPSAAAVIEALSSLRQEAVT